MPKVKTHSGAKKRFHVTGTGKFSYKKCGRGHLLCGKNERRIRRLRQKGLVPEAFEDHLKKLMPYV